MEGEFVRWSGVSADVKRCNKTFAQLFDKMLESNPKLRNVPMLKLKVPYGDFVVENGKLLWNRIDVKEADKTKLDRFRYGTIPICLVLNRSFEVWTIQNRGHIDEKKDPVPIPHLVAVPGTFLGLFETLTDMKEQGWQITSGVRSLVIVPEMNNRGITNYRNKVEAADINPPATRGTKNKYYGIDQHWEVIKAAVNALSKSGTNWQAELLLFDHAAFSWLPKEGRIDVKALRNPYLLSEHERPIFHFLSRIAVDQLVGALETTRLATTPDVTVRTGRMMPRTAAQISAAVNGHVPIMSPLSELDDWLAPCREIYDFFCDGILCNRDQRFLLLGAKQHHNDDYSFDLGYLSLFHSFAEFDWAHKEALQPANLIGTAKYLTADPSWQLRCLAWEKVDKTVLDLTARLKGIGLHKMEEAEIFKMPDSSVQFSLPFQNQFFRCFFEIKRIPTALL